MQYGPRRQTRCYLYFRNPAQFFRHDFFCLHTEKIDQPKVGIANSCPFKTGTTFVLNYIVRGLEKARIRVQVFVFLLFVCKKKLVIAIIRVLLGIVHILRDVILCKICNWRGLCTTFVKKSSFLILTYCLLKLGLLWKFPSLPLFWFYLLYCITEEPKLKKWL